MSIGVYLDTSKHPLGELDRFKVFVKKETRTSQVLTYILHNGSNLLYCPSNTFDKNRKNGLEMLTGFLLIDTNTFDLGKMLSFRNGIMTNKNLYSFRLSPNKGGFIYQNENELHVRGKVFFPGYHNSRYKSSISIGVLQVPIGHQYPDSIPVKNIGLDSAFVDANLS